MKPFFEPLGGLICRPQPVLKMSGYAQWIGLRENLNRKLWFLHVFTIKYRGYPGALSGFLVGSIVPLDPHPEPVLGSGMLLYQN